MAITKGWLKEQISALSVELGKARLGVNAAKVNFNAAREQLDEAFNLQDNLEGCIAGLRRELRNMEPGNGE